MMRRDADSKNKRFLNKLPGLIFVSIFVILATTLIVQALYSKQESHAFSTPAESLSGFTYEIADGENGTAEFPNSFKNLAPHSAVTVNVEIEPGKYENLLVKTVYSRLRLYADGNLIYECGQPGSYPDWLLDPPTLLEIVPLPKTASTLQFEYISPTQRTVLSVSEVMAGSEGALLAWLFGINIAILAVSIFLLIFGLTISTISFLFRRDNVMFLHLGLFALAVGCWSFGECNATAFFVPYPVLLYLMAFVGLFSCTIPLLRYGILILRPSNPLFMRIAISVTQAAVALALALQLAGIASLSKTMYLFHILLPLGLAVFAVTTVYEYFRHKNPIAKQFALPTFVIAVASILEVVNYGIRFTNILSLLFLSGTMIFTLMLGIIGIRHVVETRRAFEEASAKNDFYHRMAHDVLTPLTRVSSNVQMSVYSPETAGERLAEAQEDVMLIAEMVNKAISESKGGGEG